MTIDERFILWLKAQNLSKDVGHKLVKKSLYKWYGFVSESVSNMNKKKMQNYQYLCVFIEFYDRWFSSLTTVEQEKTTNISELLEKLNKKLENQDQKRSKVVCEWFNYETGSFEYELEDGNFIISDKKSTGNFLAPDLIDSFFSSIYRRIVNPELFRDDQIKKIFN